MIPDGDDSDDGKQWYQGITRNRLDPYTDRTIQSLPMQVRVAVIGYAKAAKELTELSGAG